MRLALYLACAVRLATTVGAAPVVDGCINGIALSRVIYINMDHRKDRRRVMERNLANLPVPVQRFVGPRVSFDEAKSLLPNRWQTPGWQMARLTGAAGCLMSKLAVLRAYLAEHQAQQRSNSTRPPRTFSGTVLILEDDWRIIQPERLLSHLGSLLTRAIRSGQMACRPNLVRLDCWGMKRTQSEGSCDASSVVGRCRCGGTHAMLVPTWGLLSLIKLYERKLGAADCVLPNLPKNYCLNAGIMKAEQSLRNMSDIPKGRNPN
ncbi:hypothetical protein T492DRAFT_1075159 [Pavlovales sp. CCMP2436]|nr:hypothetical protein T492DRAFT_1075159 [Pavlovales sp. CCMP2436]|mmetsp:Transcript_19494/g.49571  ORF Transcript_19494/g.49571 Transcript_19494/m.49571 type:complete len:263 (+) Transcript_19494:146-934(+)